MNDFSLGQSWVSRVTSASQQDVPAAGADVSSAPDVSRLHALLHDVALTATAREMVRRKWIQPTDLKDAVAGRASAMFEFLFARSAQRPVLAMFRGRRQSAQRDLLANIATMAWVSHVLDNARASTSRVKYNPSHLSESFARDLVRLSVYNDGPKRAAAAVREIGITLVVESGLPGMSVDGASLHTKSAGPVLALTLRYDRLDNFWFTLMHELGHIALHLSNPSDDVFVDSLEESVGEEQEEEAEADAFAKDQLIPRDLWLRSDAYRLGNERSALTLADQLGVHPAIVAGRIRYERRNFRLLTDVVGEGRVRNLMLADI